MKSYNTAFDAYSSSVHQRRGHFFSRLVDDSSKRRPRHIHPARCFLLAKTFQIGEPHGLELIHRQYRQVHRRSDYRLRHEAYPWRIEADPTGFNGSCH
jgi:hypothetical protein